MAATITPESVWAHIPPRARDSHKGSFGAVLVVAGSACYRGAASLAVEGALRTGAGIVTLASVEPVLAAVSARLPECCLCPCLAGAEGGISPRSLPNITRQKATTLLLGAWYAIFQHDLKGLLAYSTISHLGLITLLFGLSTPMAVVAGLFLRKPADVDNLVVAAH